VDANARKLSVETTVVRPYVGTKAQQAGLWYGLNEENFVKLVVVNGTVEMRRELNGSPSPLPRAPTWPPPPSFPT
jgi:acyl dehydratase